MDKKRDKMFVTRNFPSQNYQIDCIYTKQIVSTETHAYISAKYVIPMLMN